MIHHVHNTLLTEINSPTTGHNAGAAPAKDHLESFHGVLSDAVGPTRGSHTAAKEGEELSGRSLIRGPINSDKLVRPPAQTPPQSTSGSLASILVDPLKPSNNTTASANIAAASGTPTMDAQQAFDHSYWAAQPAAVQALRTMQDPGQRAMLAAQLAGEGYSIDMPIMVWGWDPSIVTSMRQAEGYTWVPSALQNPVEMLPGLPGMGSMAPYNPKDPPPGSIAV